MTAEEARIVLSTMYIKRDDFSKQEEQAIDEGYKALSKKVPKHPVVNGYEILCPFCGRRLISRISGEWVAGRMQKFCGDCGQALDWDRESLDGGDEEGK